MVASESPIRKLMIAGMGFSFFVGTFVVAVIFFVRFDNTSKFQSYAEKSGFKGDNAYDVACVDNISGVPDD